MPRTSRQATGARGEDVACAYLTAKGYRIIGRNVRVGWHGEVDLIAADLADCCYVFVEVKTRAVPDPHFLPETNMDRRKRRAVFAAARQWMSAMERDAGYRVDLLCVVGKRVVDHFVEIDPPSVGRRLPGALSAG